MAEETTPQDRPIVTREEALAAGLKTYFDGRVCKCGHIFERTTSSRNCILCARLRASEWQKKNPEKVREREKRSRARHPEKHRARESKDGLLRTGKRNVDIVESGNKTIEIKPVPLVVISIMKISMSSALGQRLMSRDG
jgi:hypothetical protein